MAAVVKPDPEHNAPEELHPALDAILGANPFVGIDVRELLGSIGGLLTSLLGRPDLLLARGFDLFNQLGEIAAGISDLQPPKGDRRFTDPAWTDNPFYRALMQSYLAWRAAVHRLVDDDAAAAPEWKQAGQRRFAVTLLTEALAPTNVLWGNPAALKRAFETAGLSLIRGTWNFIDDLMNNRGMPATVDKAPFKVGRNLAPTPGAVVHRSELFELIQYQPATPRIFERPLVMIPPQINKFYIMDLAPERSFTEFAVANRVPFFTISWRNPTSGNHAWGLSEYVAACKEAIAIASEISASPDVNLLGICAGGITASLALAHLAASGSKQVNTATLLVTMLETSAPSMTGIFATPEAIARATGKSRRKGVLDGSELQRAFAWMRPNDLVWNYWVNNYLMGNAPAPFDILYWNADATCLPARLHAEFLDLFLEKPLAHSGALAVLGTPIDLGKVTADMYLVAGMTDHICAWRACYQAARMFGGHAEFVLTGSGHVQSLVSPVANTKSRYYLSPDLPESPDRWLEGAREHPGSWWEHWLTWIGERSGGERTAPEALGSARFQPLDPAPGRYVLAASS